MGNKFFTRIIFAATSVALSLLVWQTGQPPISAISSVADANQLQLAQSSSDSDSHEHEGGFTPDYISAADLGDRFEADNLPFIFDVRSALSYEKSHIEQAVSMPYAKIDNDLLATVDGLALDSQIVTYCGCPRHLSTLATKKLLDLGYSEVRVLYEGYWHWRDNGYPIVNNEATADAVSTLQFEGVVKRQNQPVAGEDIFLRHQRTGQLEAVRSAADGSFQVDFHLYGHQAEDRFEVITRDLNRPPVTTLAATSRTTALEIVLN